MEDFKTNPQQELEFKKKVALEVQNVIKNYTSGGAFPDRKITDLPTDSFSVVNRKFATLNGSSANRPTSSVVGQQYFDTTLASGRGKTITWNGTGFVDGTGTYV